MYVVFGSDASAPIDFEYVSMYWTNPSFSYSSYPGRANAISSRTSVGPLSVRIHRTGTPFLSPSAMNKLEHLLADVGGAVHGGVRPERDAAEQQVVEPRDAHLDLLLLHLDLEVFVPGLDVLRNEALLPQPEFFHLLLEVPLLRADLLFLRRDRTLQFLEARLEIQFLY